MKNQFESLTVIIKIPHSHSTEYYNLNAADLAEELHADHFIVEIDNIAVLSSN